MNIRHYLLIGLVMLLSACAGPGAPREDGVSPAVSYSRFVGRYQGNYFGDATGSLSMEVHEDGNILWEGESLVGGGFSIRGSVEFSDERWMLRGSTHGGTRFLGFLEEDGRFSGTWDGTDGSSGSFELNKVRAQDSLSGGK